MWAHCTIRQITESFAAPRGAIRTVTMAITPSVTEENEYLELFLYFNTSNIGFAFLKQIVQIQILKIM